MPSSRRWRVNSTIRMLFETAMPTSMTTPISDITFSVVPGQQSVSNDACEARRHGEQDDERIDERAELRHQNQKQQHHSETEPKRETAERMRACPAPCRAT